MKLSKLCSHRLLIFVPPSPKLTNILLSTGTGGNLSWTYQKGKQHCWLKCLQVRHIFCFDLWLTLSLCQLCWRNRIILWNSLHSMSKLLLFQNFHVSNVFTWLPVITLIWFSELFFALTTADIQRHSLIENNLSMKPQFFSDICFWT